MTIHIVSESDSSVRPAPIANQLRESEGDEYRPVSAIDSEQLMRQCVGNLKFAISLLTVFEETSELRRTKFDAALIEGRNDVIAHEAHALKGVAGILAANQLTDLCVELQTAAEVVDWRRIRNLIETLHHEIQRVIHSIPEIRAAASKYTNAVN